MRLLLLLWFAWAVFWMASAVSNKATRRRESPASRLLHIVPLTLGGMLLAWSLPALVPFTRFLRSAPH